ncbi:MAG: hypothetical protein WDN48_14250 [Pseudolabrys sp.]
MNLSENFKTELAKIYADNKPGRREHILTATARLRAKYNAKLVNARRDDPSGAATAELAIVRIENEHAAKLAA